MKESIHLRKREIKEGTYSLYLDTYTNGKRSYEYLKLYLVEEKGKKEREQNKKTLELAEAIKAKRIVELRNGQFGFENKREKEKTNFSEYIEKIAKGEHTNILLSVIEHLNRFDTHFKKRTFEDIDSRYLRDFKNYLEGAKNYKYKEGGKSFGISQNTRKAYFDKLKTCIRRALREEIIEKDPTKRVDNFKKEETERMYLTIEELKKIASVDCGNERDKRAFLFSCLTGLRLSDIRKLKWGDVFTECGFTRIIFRQKKTKFQEYLDVNREAVELMGERRGEDKFVFDGLTTDANLNLFLRKICAKCGIDKKITFHCGRHTFATMMIGLGTDLYTVSKLLGHREIGTTQIYAKMMDSNKQKAVENIPSILKKE